MDILKKNRIFECRIDGYSSEGHGVCHVDGRAVFVPRTVAGEKWLVRIVKTTSTAVYGKGEELIEASPSRATPDCPYFGKCGGCDTRHMDYDEELRFKLGKVNDALRRIGKQHILAEEIIAADSIVRYRNKGIFAVGEAELPFYGFYRERSHEIIPISSCLIQNELSDKAAAAVIDYMHSKGISAYDEKSSHGTVRHVFCRCAVKTSDAVVCVVARRGLGSDTQGLVDALRTACPELTGIVLNINKSSGNTVLCGDFYTLWGKAEIRDILCGFEFEIAPQAFFQINPLQAEKLYCRAVEYAFPHDEELAFDLYCGAGTISMCLSNHAKKVIGAEIVPEAIENARKNAAANGIENVDFICADAGKAAQALAAQGLRPGVVVVDPPRKGMDEPAISAAAAMCPDRIVYVSCNPSTLARDILRFNIHGYELKKVTAVDMFPRTSHVETVVQLVRKKPDDYIRIKMDMEDFDLTRSESKATYDDIKTFVQQNHGMKVSSLYIAQVKEKYGIKERENYYLGEEGHHVPQCTPEKEEAIVEALKHFQMIS